MGEGWGGGDSSWWIPPTLTLPHKGEGLCSLLAIGFALLPQLLETFTDLRLVTAIDRFVITAVFAQVFLIDPAAFEIVTVLVALATPELLGAPVMRIA